MPAISLFLGIRITMYYDDHNPHIFMPSTPVTRRLSISDAAVS